MPINRDHWREELKERFEPGHFDTRLFVRDGWKEIVCDLHDALEKTDLKYKFSCIKEKFGKLRCYAVFDKAYFSPKPEELHGRTLGLDVSVVRIFQGTFKPPYRVDTPPFSTFFQLLEDAEQKSATICECCAKPGHLRPGPWIQALCDSCDALYRQSLAAK